MEFVKQNWLKLAIITLSFIGMIFAIVVMAEMGMDDFMASTGMITWLLFFIGMIAFGLCLLLKVKKCTSAFVLLAVGALTTLFAFLFLIHAIQQATGDMADFLPPAVVVVTPALMQLIVLGLFPLLKGIKKVLKCKDTAEAAE